MELDKDLLIETLQQVAAETNIRLIQSQVYARQLERRVAELEAEVTQEHPAANVRPIHDGITIDEPTSPDGVTID